MFVAGKKGLGKKESEIRKVRNKMVRLCALLSSVFSFDGACVMLCVLHCLAVCLAVLRLPLNEHNVVKVGANLSELLGIILNIGIQSLTFNPLLYQQRYYVRDDVG